MKEKNASFFCLTTKAVILNPEEKVLVLKRIKGDLIGAEKFDLPGGKIEFGEDIEKALKREILEELGIEIELGPIIYSFDFDKKFDKEYEIEKNKILVGGKGLRFLAYYKKGEIRLSSEHEKYEWLDFESAIDKFGDSEFEKDKIESIKKAKEYLEMKKSLDGWKRERADFENYKKRQAEDRKDMIAFSNLNLISEILPILDNFHASTDHIPKNEKENPWVIGIMHIQKQLEKVLEDYGVSEISVNIGDKFDPNIMEAIEQENKEKAEKSQENKVKKVLIKGYKINGKIIRVAKVVVE